MKKNLLLLLIAFAGIGMQLNAQSSFNLGLGYYGETNARHGAVLEFEYEKFQANNFSLPLKANVGFHTGTDYNALTIDVHKGFRKYFESGLFLEQFIGVGFTSTKYTIESIWYYDKYLSLISFRDDAIWGFTPSVTLGLGYNLTNKKETQNLIWIRPKVYWNLGFRGLNLPYGALQVGYTHNFKTKG